MVHETAQIVDETDLDELGVFENRQQVADTKRTHQNRHARRLATHGSWPKRADLQGKVSRVIARW
jgi:hypothetical protein